MDLEAWKLSDKLLMSVVFNIFQRGILTLQGYCGTVSSFKVSFSGNSANSALESLKLGQFKNAKAEPSLSKVSNLFSLASFSSVSNGFFLHLIFACVYIYSAEAWQDKEMQICYVFICNVRERITGTWRPPLMLISCVRGHCFFSATLKLSREQAVHFE